MFCPGNPQRRCNTLVKMEGEKIVELNSEDMLTECQMESFETLWKDRVKR